MKVIDRQKLPFLTSDSFADWDNVSVARSIEYTNVRSIARHLGSRDNYDPELSDTEIVKFQRYLYEDCLTPDEKKRITFDEFIDRKQAEK